ncbi:MAG: polymer-forming cytoskeletal protein, partial [Akkermansia sp.]
MKLHLPVKLRSNLIAAVIAVSAAVYNAQATTYTEPIQQLTSQYQQTAGNTYDADTSITIGTTTPTGDKLITFIEGETTLKTDALIIKNSVMLGATGTAEIHGNTNIEADSSITIEKDSNNQGSRVELVDANVTTAATSVAQASALVIVDGKQDLSDAQKVSLNITGTDLHTDLVHNDPEHTIELGALTNDGSVTLIGNKEHSEATVDADSSVTTAQAWENAAAIVDDGVDLTLDGVTGTGSLNIGNANAAITGDVTQNDLNLVNSATAVTGTVSTKGIELNNESSLVATGDITAGEANSGVSIAGQLQSSGGNISLTNGVHGRGNGLREGASVVATTGNITLNNVGGQSLHGLEAGNEIRLTGSDTIITDTDNIQAGERLTVENGAILRRDTVGDMNDDLTINQGELEDVTIGNVGGDASITDSTLTNTEIGAITGDLTIEATPGNDNTLTNVTIGTVDGDADITNSTLTDTEIGDIDGDADITDSTLEGTAIGNIGGNATISGSTLGDTTTTEEDGSVTTTNSTLGDITGDLTIENGSQLTNATIGTVGGNADIDNSTLTGTEIGNITGDLTIENASELTNATIGTVGGDVTINNSTLEGVSTTDEDGNITVDTTTIGTISGALVIENGSDISDTEIAGAGSVAVDDSTVSDTSVTNIKGDITITNDSDVSNTVLTTADEAVTGNITINGSTVTTTTIGLDENNTNGTLAGDIDITNNSTVQGATISATQGHLHIADSTLLGHTDGTTYTKTDIALSGSTTDTLGVTDNANTIASSSVSGTNIELSAPTSNLTVNADSHITGDTNISVGDTLTITGGSELALDGAAQTTDGTDASISADKLVLETLNNNSASIRNGQIHVETQTTIKDGNTLTLTAVNGGTAVDGRPTPGTLGDLVQTTNDGTVNTKLNVLGGSTIETGAIATQDGLSGDKQSLDHYFDQVLVKEDSQLTATETVALRQLYVGSEAGGYTADSGSVGSSVTFEKDAWLVAARVNGNEGAGLDTKLTINGNAHIGTLTPNNGGSVNLVATEDGVHSYIANISSGSYGAPHTALNVVNEELSTPVLRSDYVDLGLNGGTITLERVSAANGATVASTADVNPHVLVRNITNASATGAPDGTALGSSTIRTTLNHVSVPYSYSPGEAVTTECRTYYYVARMDGTLSDGRTVTAGQLIERKDLIVTTTTLSDGTVVETGIIRQDATTLTANDANILDRIDVPALDENGNLQYAANGEVLVTGQQVTTELITYYPQATETLGTLETVNDGIASLTVKQNVDADSLTIKAYETGTLDTNNRVVADANTGYITIEGNLTGTHANFTADNNISIAGIVADGSADTENNNTLLSNRGNIAIGANGITGSGNSLTATTGSVSVQGATNGNENVLTAETTVTTGAITGDSNELTAGTTVTTGAITGNDNVLDAGTSITTGAITGDDNVLTAGTTITVASIDGDSNMLDATESIEVTGTLEGASNVLTADTSITTGALTGDENELTAGTTITVASIDGDSNTLDAQESIEVTGTLEGASNVLTAGTSITTGALTGDDNVLTAGTSITTGALTGDDNVLTAGTTITVASIDGDRNELTASNGNLTVTGGVEGENNVLSAIRGSLSIGTQAGENAQLTAQKTISIGTLAGKGHELTAYANGLSQDDVAIRIGSFAAQGSTLHMATTTDPDFGTATGNGSIIIDALTAVDGAPDAALMNNITAGNSYVQLGSLNGFNAYTTITAAKDLIITGTGTNSASNQRWNAANVQLTTLTLSDSVINTSGSITGTSLTLTTTGTTTFGSTATGSVTLDSLSLGGYATLTTGSATIGTLTITGTHATLLATNADIAHLILRDGASYDGTNLRADDLDLVNSSMVVARLDDVDTLTLDNSSVTITGAQGFVNRSGDITLENGSTFSTTTAAIATSGNITLSGQSAISSAQGISGAVISVTDSSLTAGAALRASGKLTGTAAQISAASVSAAGMELTDSQLTANGGIALNNNALKLTDSTVNGNIAGATSAELTNATTGGIQVNGALTADHSTTGAITGTVTNATITNGSSIGSGFTMSDALTVTDSTVNGDITGATSAALTNASTGNVTLTNGALTADHSTLGAISGASTVELTNRSTVTGDVTMSDALTVTDSTVNGNIMGATSAALTNASTGGIQVSGALTADHSTTGAITGTVTNATITNGSSIGSGFDMSGALTVAGSTVNGNIMGATSAALTNASTGGIQVSGALTADHSTTGAITGTVTNATITNGSIIGSGLDMSGALTVTDSTVNGNIAGATSAALTNASTGGIQVNGELTITGGSTVTGDVTAAGDALVSGSNTTVSGTVSGANVILADHAQAGSVSTDGTAIITDATVTESLTADTLAADGAILKDATVTNANLSDNTQVRGTLTMDGGALTANHATVNAITGTVTNATITNGSSIGSGFTMSDALTVTDSTVNGDITGATSAALTNASTGNVTLTNGALTADHSTLGAISGASTVELTNGSTVTGDVAMHGKLTMSGSTVVGSVSGATDAQLTQSSRIEGNLGMHGDLTITGGSIITGTVTGASKLTVGDAASVGGVDGNFDEVVIDGSVSGAVTATDGSVTVQNGATVNGSITTTAVTDGKNHDISVLTGSTVTGNVTAAGDALVSGSNTTVSG